MERELLIFAIFGGLATTFNHIEAVLHERQHVANNLFHRMLYHENTLHAIRDYAIHFMIYSGYVFGH